MDNKLMSCQLIKSEFSSSEVNSDLRCNSASKNCRRFPNPICLPNFSTSKPPATFSLSCLKISVSTAAIWCRKSSLVLLFRSLGNATKKGRALSPRYPPALKYLSTSQRSANSCTGREQGSGIWVGETESWIRVCLRVWVFPKTMYKKQT